MGLGTDGMWYWDRQDSDVTGPRESRNLGRRTILEDDLATHRRGPAGSAVNKPSHPIIQSHHDCRRHCRNKPALVNQGDSRHRLQAVATSATAGRSHASKVQLKRSRVSRWLRLRHGKDGGAEHERKRRGRGREIRDTGIDLGLHGGLWRSGSTSLVK